MAGGKLLKEAIVEVPGSSVPLDTDKGLSLDGEGNLVFDGKVRKTFASYEAMVAFLDAIATVDSKEYGVEIKGGLVTLKSKEKDGAALLFEIDGEERCGISATSHYLIDEVGDEVTRVDDTGFSTTGKFGNYDRDAEEWGEGDVFFDNTDTGLSATDACAAIKEVNTKVATASTQIIDLFSITATHDTNGYVDLGGLGLTSDPVAAKNVSVAVLGMGNPYVNHARVGSTGVAYDFRMGDVNKKRMYIKGVNGVDGDFSGGASGVTQSIVEGNVVDLKALA